MSKLGAQSLPGTEMDDFLAHVAREMNTRAGQQIVHIEELSARESHYAAPSPPLPEPLQRALASQGISRLYTHQVEALERVRQGENVVVVTATSSGKTLCYNLPIMEHMLADRDARALYLYPINALVNDQLKSLFKMNLALGHEALGISRYTAALSQEQRREARARDPHIWLTNPEMLHYSFLLWRQNWESLWTNLRYVVVDEVHTYRGVFGSNMAQLFRRLLRVARHYGSTPQFICCSATIANPRELAEALTGEPFSVIDRDGAGSGRKHFVLWNPPLEGDDDANLRRSYSQESVDLLLHCLQTEYNTIVFARARGLTERMLRMSRTVATESGHEQLLEKISSYRAGYLAQERESIETKLKTGEIQGIITTNALEMGIDIGGLDVAIISGYPGSIMSTWQQAGRAGRRGKEALVFWVASQNPLDQYYVQHPREFFAQPHEVAIIDLDNQHIHLKHLLCAARELPFAGPEIEAMPAALQALIRELHRLELLTPCEDDETSLTYPKDRRDIHFRVSLRSASHESYDIVDENRNKVGSISPPNVFRETHPGAVYQHGGDSYRVSFLDRQRKVVRVSFEQAPHYTQASSALNLRVEHVYTTQTLCVGEMSVLVSLGDVLAEETVFSYRELRLGTDELVKRVNLSHPLTTRMHTTAMWIAFPSELIGAVDAAFPVAPDGGGAAAEGTTSQLGDGLHAVQHLLTSVMPLLVMCDRRDVDGFYHVSHPDLEAPALFVYDACEGGIGLAEVAYQRIGEILELAYSAVVGCRCAKGCPSCIQTGSCRLRNESLDKAVARWLLAQLVDREQALVGDTSVLNFELVSLGEGVIDAGEGHALSRKLALDELLEQTRRRSVYEHISTTERPAPQKVTCKFAKGDRVTLSPYGRGTVLDSRIEGNREIVRVRFVRRGAIKEVDASGPLTKLG